MSAIFMKTKKDSFEYKIIERDIENILIYNEAIQNNNSVYAAFDAVARTRLDQPVEFKMDMVMDEFLNYFVEESVSQEIYTYEF